MVDTAISIDSVNEAKNYLIQYLMDSGYDGSIEDGTAIHDAVLKPMSLLLVLFQAEAKKARAYYSLDKAIELKDTLGDEYDSVVDAVLGNWFVYRRQGSDTECSIKLVFSKPLDYLRIIPGDDVATIDGSAFTAKDEKIFTESDFAVVFNNVQNRNEYAVSLTCKTVDPARVELTTDTAATSNLSNIYLIRAEVAGGIKLGSDIEDSDAFIDRTATAITTRELISDRAIKVGILEKFADIVKVYVARYGSDEQMRDIKTLNAITVHVGNMADIYLKHTPTYTSDTYTVESGSLVTLTGQNGEITEVVSVRDTTSVFGALTLKFSALPTLPFTVLATDEFTVNETVFTADADTEFLYADFLDVIGTTEKYIVLDVYNTAGTYVDVAKGTAATTTAVYENFNSAEASADFEPMPVDFSLSGIDETMVGSTGVYPVVSVPTVAEGSSVDVHFLTTDVVSDAEGYVSSDDQRVACYHPLCKGMFPVCVHMDLVVRQIEEPELDEDALVAKIAQTAAAYTNSIAWRRAFSVSEFVHYMHANIADIEQVMLPAVFTAKLRDPADLTVNEQSITGVYELPAGMSQQVTLNTTMYFTDPSWVRVRLYR